LTVIALQSGGVESWASEGVRREFPEFGNLICCHKFLVEKHFSHNFGVGKISFYHCWPPPGKIPFGRLWKDPSDAHEQNIVCRAQLIAKRQSLPRIKFTAYTIFAKTSCKQDGSV